MVEPTYIGRAMSTPEKQSSEEIDFQVFVKNIAATSNEARLSLAQQLKDAGLWRGKVSSKFDTKYYTALINLEEKYKGQLALDKIVEVTTPAKRLDVLANIIAGDGEDGEDGTTKQTYITSRSQTAKLLNKVAVDLLERNLTKAEQAKYLPMINAEQRKQPSIQTQSDGSITTLGGVDEEQFITEKLQATSEAKNVRATDAYSIMMEEFGGLR